MQAAERDTVSVMDLRMVKVRNIVVGGVPGGEESM